MAWNLAKQPTFPPARNPEQRQKQLADGITPEFGRGSNGGTSPLPHGAGWLSHTGRRQRMRSFNRAWDQFEKKCKIDAHYQSTRERLLDWLVETETPEADLEFAAKAIVHTCLVKSAEHAEQVRLHPEGRPMVDGTDWVDELNAALNQWEASGKKPVSPTEEV